MFGKMAMVVLAVLVGTSWIGAIPTGLDQSNLEDVMPPYGCEENEYPNNAVTCEPSCYFPDNGSCYRILTNGCVCKGGYIRNNYWECIKIEDCPPLPHFKTQ